MWISDRKLSETKITIKKLSVNGMVRTHTWCRFANVARKCLCSNKNISVTITFKKVVSIYVIYKECTPKCWFKADSSQNRSPTDLCRKQNSLQNKSGRLSSSVLSGSAMKRPEQKGATAVYFSKAFW